MPDDTQSADFVTILSSDMIAQIVEEYFNKKVYKQQVEVVDAKATEAGYMFSLAFVQQQLKKDVLQKSKSEIESYIDSKELMYGKRNTKGQFVKDNV